MSDELHRGVGRYIASEYEKGRKTDVLITVGRQAEFIADEAEKAVGITVKRFSERQPATEYLKANLTSGDIAIIKGSRGMKMDEIVNELI